MTEYLRMLWGIYRRLCPSLTQKAGDEAWRKACFAAVAQKRFSTVDYYECFWLAERSDYLKGGGRWGWKADFLWLITPENMQKVLSEQYSVPLLPLERKANRQMFRMYCEEMEKAPVAQVMERSKNS